MFRQSYWWAVQRRVGETTLNWGDNSWLPSETTRWRPVGKDTLPEIDPAAEPTSRTTYIAPHCQWGSPNGGDNSKLPKGQLPTFTRCPLLVAVQTSVNQFCLQKWITLSCPEQALDYSAPLRGGWASTCTKSEVVSVAMCVGVLRRFWPIGRKNSSADPIGQTANQRWSPMSPASRSSPLRIWRWWHCHQGSAWWPNRSSVHCTLVTGGRLRSEETILGCWGCRPSQRAPCY